MIIAVDIVDLGWRQCIAKLFEFLRVLVVQLGDDLFEEKKHREKEKEEDISNHTSLENGMKKSD